MLRAVVIKCCAGSAVILCVAGQPSAAQELLRDEPDQADRRASEGARRAPTAEASGVSALCERANASKNDYLPIWREEFLKRNSMPVAYFDEHVKVVATSVSCWQDGASFNVQYRLTNAWASSDQSDQFMILLYGHVDAWRHRDVPRDRLFSAAEVSRAIDWEIGSARMLSVAQFGSLRFASRAEAITALEQAARGEITDVDLSYLPGRPHLRADGVISSPENRCFDGDLDLVTGEARVREQPCRVGEPWPAKAVPPDSPCDAPGQCAPTPAAPSEAGWRCSPQTIAAELPAEWMAVTRVDVIPRDVLSAFGIEFMANPGEEWSSGCVQDGRRPRSQLVFAAHTPRIWVLTSRHGGIAVNEGSSFFCRDVEGDWVHSVRPHTVASLSDLRTLPAAAIEVGQRPLTRSEAELSGIQWVFPAGQSSRNWDVDATQLRGVVLEGKRLGDQMGIVLARVDVWRPGGVAGKKPDARFL